MPAITLTTLPIFATDETLGWERMEQLRSILYDQGNPPFAIYDRPTTDPNLTTTVTAASFGAMDDTIGKFGLTIVTKGNPVLLGFRGMITHNTATNYAVLDVDVDGALIVGGAGSGLLTHYYAATTDYWDATFSHIITGLAAGSHTFKMRWRVTAGTATLQAAHKTQFFVREL